MCMCTDVRVERRVETRFHLGTWAESMSFSHNYTGRVFHGQGRVVGEESHDTCDPNLASPSRLPRESGYARLVI